jgi:hypothetical protein
MFETVVEAQNLLSQKAENVGQNSACPDLTNRPTHPPTENTDQATATSLFSLSQLSPNLFTYRSHDEGSKLFLSVPSANSEDKSILNLPP